MPLPNRVFRAKADFCDFLSGLIGALFWPAKYHSSLDTIALPCHSLIPLYPTLSLLGNISTNTFHPLIPLSFCKPIFLHLHSLGHPGIHATHCSSLPIFSGPAWLKTSTTGPSSEFPVIAPLPHTFLLH